MVTIAWLRVTLVLLILDSCTSLKSHMMIGDDLNNPYRIIIDNPIDNTSYYYNYPFYHHTSQPSLLVSSKNKMIQDYAMSNDTIKSQTLNYCSFFNNRAPTPQINLKNCTWYQENSCCLQAEIESTFSKVKPLIGSSVLCQKYVNYLMCYICAPVQFKFYGKERLTVCEEYCDRMYDACGSAILKGSRIKEIYRNGTEFCISQRYIVDKLERDNCFYYDVESAMISSSLSIHSTSFILPVLLLIYKNLCK